MKNSLTLLLFLVFLQSCKKESETQATADTTIVENNINKDSLRFDHGVYNGLGTFESNGDFVYHISLPKPPTSNSYQFKLYNIDNQTIFIHLDNKSKHGLTNTNNDVFELKMRLPKDANSSPYKSNYGVFLWHDDVAVNSADQAERIMNGDSLVSPKKVGIGILSRK